MDLLTWPGFWRSGIRALDAWDCRPANRGAARRAEFRYRDAVTASWPRRKSCGARCSLLEAPSWPSTRTRSHAPWTRWASWKRAIGPRSSTARWRGVSATSSPTCGAPVRPPRPRGCCNGCTASSTGPLQGMALWLPVPRAETRPRDWASAQTASQCSRRSTGRGSSSMASTPLCAWTWEESAACLASTATIHGAFGPPQRRRRGLGASRALLSSANRPG
mmetsp:Transcript_45991/g.127697  ORF Transcript_45991/g.127697 Transcript_45991/m.127697 type:complete len:220 (+) Transcript_45991:68-727(+)